METIRSEIKQLTSASEHDVEVILGKLRKVELKKDIFLLRSGEICRHYYFVEEGTVRLYYNKGEEDYTVWLGTPGQIFTNLESYLDGFPSNISIQAIEQSVVYTISKNESDHLASIHNSYNTLLRKTVEKAFVSLSRNVISFQSDEAPERYARVEKEKDWLSKYPLRYISSFIGVTQSTLSRIRARKS